MEKMPLLSTHEHNAFNISARFYKWILWEREPNYDQDFKKRISSNEKFLHKGSIYKTTFLLKKPVHILSKYEWAFKKNVFPPLKIEWTMA